MKNRYSIFWFPILGLHFLHQIEESISFFQWYIDNAAKIPNWLLITSVENAKTVVTHPAYFIIVSVGQIFLISLFAFLFRNRERATRIILLIYISGLSFFLLWHIIICYFAHSYAPIMVTCICGMYLIPFWIKKLLSGGLTSKLHISTLLREAFQNI